MKNPVQAIVTARLKQEAFRKVRIESAIVETTAAVLIALAESEDYQLSLPHFMDFFPTEYNDIDSVNWNQLISGELSVIKGISHWVASNDAYVVSSSAVNLIEADLSKYFK